MVKNTKFTIGSVINIDCNDLTLPHTQLERDGWCTIVHVNSSRQVLPVGACRFMCILETPKD